MKNEKVELTGISRFYSIEYERDDGDNVSVVIEEMWDALSESQGIDICSVKIDGLDIEMLLPELSQKTVQTIKAEIFEVFERFV